MTAGHALRPLRHKLTTTLLALGLLALLVTGVTGHTVAQWRETERTLSGHYGRSLRLQEVRALCFRQSTQLSAAVLGADEDVRTRPTAHREQLDTAFAQWTALAEDDAERAEIAAVLAAAERLDASAGEVLDLVDAGRRDLALERLGAVEASALRPFEEVTTAAVDGDRVEEGVVRGDAAAARRTAAVVLALAAVGVLSMLLLIAAYLSRGVFTPVRALRDALHALNAGATGVRLPEDGDDELTQVNRELNALAASLERRSAAVASAPGPDGPVSTGQGADDAQLVLRRLVGGLRREVERIPAQLHRADAPTDPAAALALMAKIDALSATLGRPGGLDRAVDLRLTRVEPAALLHAVVNRVADEVVSRSVSCDIAVDPRTGPLVVDRVRLTEALGELVRNSLDALPARGGQLALRALRETDGWVSLEVEDDGSGLSDEDVSRLDDGSSGVGGHGHGGVGLRLATSVVEQHRGRVQLQTLAAGGTVARVLLPPAPGTGPPAGDSS